MPVNLTPREEIDTWMPAPPGEALKLQRPLPNDALMIVAHEWHYTPKHGSWLDMVESELGVLSSQCLGRRNPDKQTPTNEIAAWADDRNANHAKADWQITTADARIKLEHLYPSI